MLASWQWGEEASEDELRWRANSTRVSTTPILLFAWRRGEGGLSQLLNKPYDAFADEGADEDTQLDAKAVKKQPDSIHIRIQQRNGRKTITTISGIPTDFDLKKLAKAMKKDFACNASIEEHEVHGQVLQMQGDQRQKSMDFFLKEGIATKETVKMHGF
ncbi:hypothetical protein BMF94_3083 [Rhodotorula taiwanensis]|uniref:SUI1 domain-containing protein n=1 Tax=Rhodotorula taiwanensis TaxID=741276 RepID=A0A2S5BAV7_9BASI|nr:hypothetical protein BMF94_3083 [Rhodotorula taiwanensis]